jgi:hypothetical protein
MERELHMHVRSFSLPCVGIDCIHYGRRSGDGDLGLGIGWEEEMRRILVGEESSDEMFCRNLEGKRLLAVRTAICFGMGSRLDWIG